jgi:hypothetical protein
MAVERWAPRFPKHLYFYIFINLAHANCAI